MSYASLRVEPVPPIGVLNTLVICPCGSVICPATRQVQRPIPEATAAVAGMKFRMHRVELGLPKSDAARRLGVTRGTLEALERGLARCDWAAARAALLWRARAEA
jgi:DNA-binding XRE family transcriptional regulator